MRAEIAARGPITFARFMEQALYHPALGYYSSGRAAIGRRGDYLTSVSVGPLFGKLLAVQFREIWETLGRPDDFTLVEQGAHRGEFACDVLRAARDEAPEFLRALVYRIVEPFPVLQQRQRAQLAEFAGKVTWRDSLCALEPFTGAHFSNELLDAMPVHLLAWDDSWHEKLVTTDGAGFRFVLAPVSDPRLAELPPAHGHYETEVNLAARAWIAELAPKLVRGCILIADYGYSRAEFYSSHRTAGTLACSAQHRRRESPFESLGEIDITAHIEWTSIAESAAAAGLTLAGFADQHHFLTALAAGAIPDAFGSDNAVRAHERRALQTLLHPSFFGMRFQFLAFTKALNPSSKLTGFRFARDARTALGLGPS